MEKDIKKNEIENKNREKAFEIQNVSFSYDLVNNVLNDVSFDIYENEYVCIIGHNGSGKSTISKVLVGLLKPHQGNLKIFGETISYLNFFHLRTNVGIIFQNPDSQFIGLSAKDDIAFGLENRKINPSVMDDIIESASEVVDIKELLDKDSSSLSGGQKQRVAIASVLATNPRIIIFDESTSMLDPRGKMELKKIMLDLKNKANKTVISITHDMDEVLNADRVIVFKKGQIIRTGKPSEIFTDEEFLASSALDFPFILKLSKELKSKNVNVNFTINKEQLLDQICKKK
ncbi:energy-coupling factor transporter ATPase [Malacoplasma penetrans]|uniref:Energy-coupling factor transporter ATP-binding protein EcfA n=1 Tax=Malacoplasma penetrans (strain HF-2) TaxID=272633 RepID=ECFA_MALP2|nr:energy-coupling factor transporter ATPase [Malacoplasma penetrans]Q8EUF1.1 RecName: Full=Energy-coupling factor transporter ATP-binding protein EcfA; Short=ECF transporter A component EcfA [Malacoplasma penetrans HF-2]RXY96015.1 energy-coupling factor transporter ATPase [Malacoplasma penetrans]BAC44763.1 cobalt transport ATP-binding protein [Malacoplasma penetrans HF-2]